MDIHKSTQTDSRRTETRLAEALDFTTAVGPNGYAWWYVDALSDDGQSGLTIIAFVGSVFSPYYAAARRRGEADPENHVALNVALYGKGGKRWAMTERARGALARTCLSWRVGPSALSVDGGSLSIEIDEWSVPWPSRLRGRVRVTPVSLTGETFALDDAGLHLWRPIAPRCRVEVEMEEPVRSWRGEGYLDRNQGTRPLEDDFSYWDWSRVTLGERSFILYDVVHIDRSTKGDRSEQGLALLVDTDGTISRISAPPRQILPPNRWRVPRRTQSDAPAKVLETFEDTPFYSRSLIEMHLLGETAIGMHESLSLERFAQRWVQTLLPFRMPRRPR